MPDIDSVPVEDFEFKKQAAPETSKVGTKEFVDALNKEFSEGKPWRSTKSLAEKLNVDPAELDGFLRNQKALCCRASKEEGVFLYALTKRVEKREEKPNTRPLVNEEDRYALASLHSAFLLLESALEKYALKIHQRNPEAFTQLVTGKDKIEAGIALFGTKLKADLSKLPKV